MRSRGRERVAARLLYTTQRWFFNTIGDANDTWYSRVWSSPTPVVDCSPCAAGVTLARGTFEVLKGTLHPSALSFVVARNRVLLLNGRASFPRFPQRWETSVFTSNTSCFKWCHMTILTLFKEGSVRVQALVRLQASTFLGQEGTKIEMVVTFQPQIWPAFNTD